MDLVLARGPGLPAATKVRDDPLLVLCAESGTPAAAVVALSSSRRLPLRERIGDQAQPRDHAVLAADVFDANGEVVLLLASWRVKGWSTGIPMVLDVGRADVAPPRGFARTSSSRRPMTRMRRGTSDAAAAIVSVSAGREGSWSMASASGAAGWLVD